MQQIPMPPVEFQSLVCGPGAEAGFEEVGGWVRDALAQQGMLLPGTHFLDVGCGCGRPAPPRGDGDHVVYRVRPPSRHGGLVHSAIAAQDPRFRFDYFALKSVYTAWDQQAGTLDAETFRFPYPDAAFDAVLLASVFTHMPPAETRQYLGELARVMRPGAQALVSVFLSPTGATETTHDGLNVFLDLRAFLEDVGAVSLRATLITLQAVPGMPAITSVPLNPQPVQSFDGVHNWYVLSR